MVFIAVVWLVILNMKEGLAFRQRDINISDMANCLFRDKICRKTTECKVDLWFQPDYLFMEDCSSTLGSQFVLCDDCWLDIDKISTKVHVEGVNNKHKQFIFHEIITYAIKHWCPIIGCRVLKFQAWSPTMTSTKLFSNLSREDVVYLDNLIADKFQTKLTIIKKIHKQTALGAVDPFDVIRVLEMPGVQKLLKDNRIIVTRDDERTNQRQEGETKDESEDKSHDIQNADALNARILVLILFSVVLFAVFLSILMFRNKNWCCKDPQPDEEECGIRNDDSAQNVHGIDLIIRPPPYTTEDEYKNKHSPPSYSDAVP